MYIICNKQSAYHILSHNSHCVVSDLMTVTNCVESPNEQLQYSRDNRHSARYIEHGSSKTTAFGTLDLTRSDSWCRSSRKLRRLWRGVTVAVEQRNGDHWCNWDCWLGDESIQTKHHWRQRVTACPYSFHTQAFTVCIIIQLPCHHIKLHCINIKLL